MKRNFGRLIHWPSGAVWNLLELMNRGSYQVEMSDEGMMTEDIEECLQVVARPSK